MPMANAVPPMPSTNPRGRVDCWVPAMVLLANGRQLTDPHIRT